MSQKCWYCNENVSHWKRRVLVRMYGHLQEQQPKSGSGQIFIGPDVMTSVIGTVLGNYLATELDSHTPELKYSRAQVGIPRCKRCAYIHTYRQGVAVLFALVPIAILINYSIFLYTEERFLDFTFPMEMLLIAMAFVGVIGYWLGSWVSSRLFFHVRQKWDYFENPKVVMKLNSGWYIGKEPPQEASAD